MMVKANRRLPPEFNECGIPVLPLPEPRLVGFELRRGGRNT